MMRLLTILLLTFFGTSAMAQEMAGNIYNEKHESVVGAMVQVYHKSILKGETNTDYDGNYIVKPLDTGKYDLLVLAAGYDSTTVNGIYISGPYSRTQNCTLVATKAQRKCHTSEYSPVLINHHVCKVIPEQKRLPDCTLGNDAATIESSANCYTRRGDTLSFAKVTTVAPPVYVTGERNSPWPGGCRSGGTLYIVDGVIVDNTAHRDERHVDMLKYAPACKVKVVEVKDVGHFPAPDIRDLASLCPGVYQARRGDDISIGGSRTSGVGYIVDGSRILDAQPEHRAPTGR